MIRLFRVFIPVSTFTLFLADVLLVPVCFVGASYLVWEVDPSDYLLYDGGIVAILLVSAVFLLGCYFSGFYSDVYVKSRVILLYQLFLVSGITFLSEGLISPVMAEWRLPVRIMCFGSGFSIVVIFAWHLFFSGYAGKILGKASLLLVGTDPAVEAVGTYIETHPACGLCIAGHVLEENTAAADWFPGIRRFGDIGSLLEIVHNTRPSRVVVGTRRAATTGFARQLEELRFAGENIEDAAETYEKLCGMVWVRGIRPLDLVYTSRFGATVRKQIVQRYANLLLAFVLSVICLPVMIATWLFLRVRTSGRILLRIERVGLANRRFLQFRFKLPADQPPAGSAMAFVRRFHLDGLPQFLNVIKGEMCLVGPRPEHPEFVNALAEVMPYYPQRHCVPPGMTGWAQIRLGSTTDSIAALQCDLYYIKYLSMSMDTVILFQTLRSMLAD